MKRIKGQCCTISKDLLLFVALFGLIFARFAQSQVATPGAALLVDQIPTKRKEPQWRLNLGMTYSQSFFNSPIDNSFQPSWTMQGGFFYLGFSKINLIGSTTLTYDLRQESWRAGFLSLRANQKRPFLMGEDWMGLLGVSFIKPTGGAEQNSSLLGILGFHANTFSLKLAPWSVFGGYTLQYFQHEYTHHANGMPNVQWGQNFTLNVNYEISSRWIASVTGGYRMRQTYLATQRDLLFHSQDLIYVIDGQKSLTLGHSWGEGQNSIWRANGQELNLSLFDQTSSFVYLAIGMSL